MYYPGYSQVQVAQNFVTQNIAAITQAYPMVITTVNNHNYVAGLDVTFLIPSQFGMIQLNGIQGQILQVTSNTLTVNIDSTHFAVFAYPSPLPSAYTPPCVIPNSSGPHLPPIPLPYGNQDDFIGTIYNAGLKL